MISPRVKFSTQEIKDFAESVTPKPRLVHVDGGGDHQTYTVYIWFGDNALMVTGFLYCGETITSPDEVEVECVELRHLENTGTDGVKDPSILRFLVEFQPWLHKKFSDKVVPDLEAYF